MIIIVAVGLIARGTEARLVLLGAGLLMAGLAGRPLMVADTFGRSMVATMVAPICASMGFAAALRATGCDVHLIRALLAPLGRVRRAMLPGGILAAYLVNLAVPSQSSTAAALGPILVPLLVAAGHRKEVAAAALVLGASFGGDLLSPGAQDVHNLAGLMHLPPADLGARVVPPGLAGVLVATLVFALQNRRPGPSTAWVAAPDPTGPTIDWFKASIPLVPIALLLGARAGSPWLAWLLPPAGDEPDGMAGVLPVVRAMLIGTALAAAAGWREARGTIRAAFEGMGTAYGQVISLTIAAQCFGAGIDALGLGQALIRRLGGTGWALDALAIGAPWALALLSGSGSGPVLTFARTVLVRLDGHHGATTLAALTCQSAAVGRTMSPVSAVVIYGSGLVDIEPPVLIRRLLPALLAGAATAFATALMRG